jgi:hypothetical protein
MMAEENEPEVEMAEEGVMVEVPDEDETPEEPTVEETEETDQEVTEDEGQEPEPEVEEPAPKVKRPRRKAAPKKAVEPEPEIVEEAPEEPVEEPAEEATDDEPTNDFAAVLERLGAIEALLSGDAGDEAEPVVDEDAVARAEKAERELLAFKVGTRYGLSELLIGRLQGSDEASIEEDAKKLAGESGSSGGSLGKGGLDPDEDVFDPKKFVKDLRKRNNGGL